MYVLSSTFFFFFFTDPATTEIYTLSLHDALPICAGRGGRGLLRAPGRDHALTLTTLPDRKSTRLNSSHRCISYAVFCLKKKKEIKNKIHIKIINKSHMQHIQ